MRSRGIRLGLIAAGAVAALTTSSLQAATPGPNVLVNELPADAPSRVHLNSGVAIDPSNPGTLVVADTYQRDATSSRVCYTYRSTDGGTTWAGRPLTLPTGYTACNVQSGVRFAPDGSVYVTVLLQRQGGTALSLGVFRSNDGGVSFEAPSIVQEASHGTATAAGSVGRVTTWLPYLLVDPANSSRLYMGFTRCQTEGASVCRAVFSSSSDRGATWSAPAFMAPPVHFTTAQGALHPTFGIGPAGEIISIFVDSKSGTATTGPLVFTKSTDGGLTWTSKVIGSTLDYPVRGRVAVHGSNVYFVYEDQRPEDPVGRVTGRTVQFPAPRKIIYLRSTDGGETFEPERVLNTDGPGKDHSRPVISVAPNGRVDAWWYGSEFSTSNQYFDVVYTYSTDGGATFAPSMRVTEVSIDTRSGPGGAQLFYHHMASTNDATYIVWTDTRGEPAAAAPNDTYFAKVSH